MLCYVLSRWVQFGQVVSSFLNKYTIMKTIQEVSQETLKIESFLNEKKPGDFISYKDIHNNTDVEMNNRGKSFMRTATKRLKLEYSVVRGEGIELASPGTTISIMTHKLVRIDNAVKRGEKSYNNLIPFYNELNEDEQKKINFVGAAFGAIRLAASNGKKMLANKSKFIPESKEYVKI